MLEIRKLTSRQHENAIVTKKRINYLKNKKQKINKKGDRI